MIFVGWISWHELLFCLHCDTCDPTSKCKKQFLDSDDKLDDWSCGLWHHFPTSWSDQDCRQIHCHRMCCRAEWKPRGRRKNIWSVKEKGMKLLVVSRRKRTGDGRGGSITNAMRFTKPSKWKVQLNSFGGPAPFFLSYSSSNQKLIIRECTISLKSFGVICFPS